jgi:hypothetical protein
MTLKATCLIPGTTTETGESLPCPAPGDQADVKVTFDLNGVRCVGAPGQGNCPGGAGSAYSGKVQAAWAVRISDHLNQSVPNPPGPDCSDTVTCPATVVDFPLSIGAQCSGGACSYVTSFDATIPNLIREGSRSGMELKRTEIFDAGIDGDMAGGAPPGPGTCPPSCAQEGDGEDRFLHQGTYVP